ncbi:RagB/SusD family nutrient uptake outer membrane protein [Mucilaginibacter daejeonensis]|uniref:RagB/SusD family nutrient uptake outer membrane protein n=1 Tax=Mucilaginibacter daejeonensis TaxID=398049 RepID=UPI001D171231|nr:RagB/SusD family nutrient uptake outer membrane protein [Mucilaginibacter daejeonensis]UEG54985.1 RagB/SusD family nutrient uptake outer membrane protein [Mucilaginibacter daejeonensis]
MRTYKLILTMITAAVVLVTASCKKDTDFLEETQKDNLNSSNSLLNPAQFQLMSASFYTYVQRFYNSADGPKDGWLLGLGTDVCFDPRDVTSKYNNWSIVNGTDNYSGDWFNWQYIIIKIANTIIAGAANPAVTWQNDAQKNATIAEARFFRGFAYRNLANVFGDVPILEAPVTAPRNDFTRNARADVYKFAQADLTFAAANLPLTTTQPGRVVRAAADHILAEVDISLKDYDGAIAATTRIINGTDGAYSLVNARFGTRASEADKNYYYDLFVMGNQNYQTGNRESIWTAQFAVTATGGAIPGGVTFSTRPLIERMMWCSWYGQTKFGYNGTAVDSTGRGVAYVRPTNYTNYTIWRNSGTDIRNSETCIKRTYYYGPNIPASVGRPGQVANKALLTTRDDTCIYIYPNWSKFGTDKHVNATPDAGYVRNFYIIRLPETYFLRAEAYLGKNDAASAAADLNVVRSRAKATPVAASDVNIDYILDERARELFGEEFRILTLARLGLVYDRTRRFGSPESAASVQQYNNLLPIPQSSIDLNNGAPIGQNPGYR